MARPASLIAAPDAAQAAEDWYRWLVDEKRTAALTLDAYRRDLSAFLAFVRDHLGAPPGLAALAGLRTADFRAWLASRADPRDPYARTSTARALSAVRGFFRFLDKRGLAHNPAIGSVRTPKLPHAIPKPLTEAEAGDLLDLVATEARQPWVAARDLAVLTLLYGCGLRIAEAIGLNRRDAPEAETMVITGKGDKQRLVPVLPIVRQAIGGLSRGLPAPARPGRSAVRRRARRAGSTRARSRRWSRSCAACSVCPSRRPRTRCATPSPPTCSPAAATCARSRSCSATPACRPPSATPTSTPSSCSRSTTGRTRGRGTEPSARRRDTIGPPDAPIALYSAAVIRETPR